MLTNKRTTNLTWLIAASAVGVFGCSSSSVGVTVDGGSDAHSTADTGTKDSGKDAGTKDGKTGSDAPTPPVEAGSDVIAPVDSGSDVVAPPDGVAPSDSGSGALSVTPDVIGFGDGGGTAGFVPCGTTPATETFTVQNTGTSNLSWWTAFGLGAASPYSLSSNCTAAAPCAIAAGASSTVTVTAPAVPANAGITTYDDTVTVFSSAPGDTGHVVQLDESSYGAILAFSPTDQNFGQQPDNATYTQAIQLLNSGNAPVMATVGLESGSSAEFTLSATTVSVATTGGAFNVVFDPNNTTTAVSGAVAVTAPTNSTCGPLPNDLTLEGQGTQALISVSSSLNFNSGANGNNGVGVSCGTTGPTLSAIVTNTGTQAAHVTALSLANGASSAFTLPQASMLPIMVQPGLANAVSIQVVPAAIAASSAPGVNLGDTLTITTDATGDNPHAVALNETTAGAVLSLATTSFDFSPTVVGQKSSYQISLTNSGNVAAPVSFTSNNPVFTFDANVVATANGSSFPNAYFTPTAAQGYTGTGPMTVAAGTPLCSSNPSTVGLTFSGTGTTGNSFTVAPNKIDFGASTCAAGNDTTTAGTPPAASAVTLTNSSVTATPWTAALSGASASFFQLSAASGTIPAGAGGAGVPGSTSFTVQPIGLSWKASVTENMQALTAADMLGIAAVVNVTIGSGSSAQSYTVNVTETPSGAFPAWNQASVTVDPGSTGNISLLNDSTTVTNFTLTAAGNGISVTPTSGNASEGSPLQATVKNGNIIAGNGGSIAASLTTASNPLCGALPAALPVEQ